jgi:hypothetical protein
VRSPEEVHDRSDPVLGWRYWQLSARSGNLRSVTQRRIEWPPHRGLRAHCTGAGHSAPDPACDCGLYGARDLETLREHGLCLAPEVLVVGLVALWGRVIDDVAGWRGEFAYPARLSVVPELLVDATEAELVERLRSSYGVPVGTMSLDNAVAGATASMLTFQAMSAKASRPRGS